MSKSKFKLDKPKVRARMDALIERLKSGKVSEIVSVAMIARREGDHVPSDSWTISNRILAFFQTGDLDCRSFNAWRKAGRHVTKGQSAAYIWKPFKVKNVDKVTGEESWYVVGYSPQAEFGVSQTEGEPVPTFDYTPAQVPDLVSFAKSLGITVQYSPDVGYAYGSYIPGKDKITLHTASPKTFLHELGHAIHNRLMKANGGKLNGGQDPHQETVAELSAVVLAEIFDCGDFSGNAWEYIKGYNDNPVDAISSALYTVTQIVDFVIDNAGMESVSVNDNIKEAA
jgi:hypothetical protein